MRSAGLGCIGECVMTYGSPIAFCVPFLALLETPSSTASALDSLYLTHTASFFMLLCRARC